MFKNILVLVRRGGKTASFHLLPFSSSLGGSFVRKGFINLQDDLWADFWMQPKFRKMTEGDIYRFYSQITLQFHGCEVRNIVFRLHRVTHLCRLLFGQ